MCVVENVELFCLHSVNTKHILCNLLSIVLLVKSSVTVLDEENHVCDPIQFYINECVSHPTLTYIYMIAADSLWSLVLGFTSVSGFPSVPICHGWTWQLYSFFPAMSHFCVIPKSITRAKICFSSISLHRLHENLLVLFLLPPVYSD